MDTEQRQRGGTLKTTACLPSLSSNTNRNTIKTATAHSLRTVACHLSATASARITLPGVGHCPRPAITMGLPIRRRALRQGPRPISRPSGSQGRLSNTAIKLSRVEGWLASAVHPARWPPSQARSSSTARPRPCRPPTTLVVPSVLDQGCGRVGVGVAASIFLPIHCGTWQSRSRSELRYFVMIIA